MSFRQQKLIAMRRAIQKAALDLFDKHGYSGVTIRQIAQEAQTSVSTVYRQFESKEQLVLWDEADAAIEQHLTKSMGRCPPFDALQQAFLDAYANLPGPALHLLARRSRLIHSVPEVLAAMFVGLEADRKELQEALISVYKRPPMEMELVARFAFAALIAGIDRWLQEGTGDDILVCIEHAFQAARSTLN
jgi:AcrR family transcriptional regulator